MGRVDEIRQVAIRLFAERGYHGTSMKDIAEAMDIRAPSLYNHLESKQQLLRDVIVESLDRLLASHLAAIESTDDVAEQLHRATEAHVLFHASYPDEVHIGNREIPSLEEPGRSEVLQRRRTYAHRWVDMIERGNAEGRFDARSPKLATYAILEMGIGVSNWFKPDREMSASTIAWHFGDMALRIVGAKSSLALQPTTAAEGSAPVAQSTAVETPVR
jgi:AcrR family transcriptional regulator